jgi:hypothetical protein
MSEIPEIMVQSDIVCDVANVDDVDEVDFGTLQKKQKDIRVQIKKNPELNSEIIIFFSVSQNDFSFLLVLIVYSLIDCLSFDGWALKRILNVFLTHKCRLLKFAFQLFKHLTLHFNSSFCII